MRGGTVSFETLGRVAVTRLCRGSILAFMTSFVSLVSEVEVPELEENHIAMPAWGFGLMALCIFALLFALLWAFRNTAARYGAPKGHGHGSAGVRGGGQNQGVNH